jgi:hypothetical protein
MKNLVNSQVICLALIISQLSYLVQTQSVCTLDVLIRELMEDLEDNNRLDCLRKSVNPNESEESLEQKLKREKANWDSDCAFEAEESDLEDWRKIFLGNYQLKSFVDVYGNPADPPYTDFADQADMCEIVRAMVGNGVFSFGNNMENIPLTLLDKIDCYGGIGQSQICAANSGSYANSNSWVIFIYGQALRINDHMSYKLDIDDNFNFK